MEEDLVEILPEGKSFESPAIGLGGLSLSAVHFVPLITVNETRNFARLVVMEEFQ